MSFEETSKSIWLQIAGGTANTDPYTADFYGSGLWDGIDFSKLTTFIKNQQHNPSLQFDWQQYAPDTVWIRPPNGIVSIPVPGTIPYTYENAMGEKVQTELSGLLNKRKDTIDQDWGYVFNINGKDETAEAKLRIYYSGTKDKRKNATETNDPDDFRIEEKYVAITLKTENLTDFCYLINELYSSHMNDSSWLTRMQQLVAERFAKELNGTKVGSELKFLYEQIPEFAYSLIAPLIDYKTLEDHLRILKAYDDEGFFSWLYDSSGAVISLFRLMCADDSAALFKTLKDDPVLVKELYHNLDSSSTVNGVTDKNYILLANLIDALCTVNLYDGLERTGTTWYVGPGYRLNSNLLMGYDEHKDKIFLQQLTMESGYSEPDTYDDDFGGVSISTGGSYTVPVPIDDGHYYHPLALVTLIDTSADNATYFVPAIFVKAISDKAEWEQVATLIRIGFDVLGILLGVLSLGTASPLLFALAITDVTLSTADIFIQLIKDPLMQTTAGKEFLEAWDKIMLVGGILTAGPLLLRSTFQLGVKLFGQATIATTKNFLRASLIKIILEINIANFSRDSFRIIESSIEIVRDAKLLKTIVQADAFQQAGVLFAKATGQNTESLYIVVFKGEVMVNGSSRLVKEALKDISVLKGKDLLTALDNFILTEGKIVMGRSKLSLLARAKRLNLGAAKNHKGNVAVFEYVDEAGRFQTKSFTTVVEEEWRAMGYRTKPHAEKIGFDWMDGNGIKDVRAVYSELEPCSLSDHMCKLQIQAKYPNAKVSFSYLYPNDKALMAKAVKDRAKDLKDLLKP